MPWRWLRGGAVSAWVLSLASLALLASGWSRSGGFADGRGFSRSLKAAFAVLSARLLLVVAVLATQLVAVQRVRGYLGLADVQRVHAQGETARLLGKPAPACFASVCRPYVLLSLLLGLSWMVWLMELLVAISLLGNTAKAEEDVSALYVAGVVTLWLSVVVRFVSSGLPVSWHAVFGTDSGMWFTHHRARVAGSLRWVLALCCCRPAYMCGRLSSDAVMPGHFDHDQLAGASTLLAHVMQFRAKGMHFSETFGLFGKLFYDQGLLAAKASQAEAAGAAAGAADVPTTAPLAPGRIRRDLEEALHLGRFAVAPYTGLLLDSERSFCCALPMWCSTQGLCAPWRKGRLSRAGHGSVKGDHCLGGHRRKFLRYVGAGVQLHSGHVGQGACNVAYFVSTRTREHSGTGTDGGRDVVISVRGTEDIFDCITDALMCAVPVDDAADLGLPANSNGSGSGNGGAIPNANANANVGYGHAHLGALLSARALVGAVADDVAALVTSIRQEQHEHQHQQEAVAVWVVGHSLGGSVSALAALALRRRLPHANVRAVAFNPMPVLDAVALAHVPTHVVSSIIFADDVVSRLQLQALSALSDRALALKSRDERLGHVIHSSASGMWYALRFALCVPLACMFKAHDKVFVVEDYWGRARHPRRRGHASQRRRADRRAPNENQVDDVIVDLDLDLGAEDTEQATEGAAPATAPGRDEMEMPRLLVAGACVHIRRRGRKSFEAVAVGPRDASLERIVVSKDMFADHVPWRLQAALADVLGFRFDEQPEPHEHRNYGEDNDDNAGLETVAIV